MPDRITLENVTFGYTPQMILDGVTLSVPKGSMVVVTGRSGNGKSTLLETCAGLVEPLSGRVLWDGQDIWLLSGERRSALRKHVGHVFQRHALISNFTVFENVALPLRYHFDLTDWDIRERVEERLARFGIAHLRDWRPEQLSTDQARWVAFARALIVEPELLFLDESATGVDPVTAHTITHTINDLRRKHGTTVVMVSHSVRTVRSMKCAVAVLEDGRLSFLEHLGARTGPANEETETYLREDV